ncbi:MAG: DUF3310 domain-containing protein [Sutterellaceae bacterium]|nr:DUF3310 domain-containing protein [Sutterellaceae bacterium]MDD7442863.1 DUF3310 domain-containing protein [Sutterellaceae bacterium]MDY2867531.1 DUF3310 domain-containing protein [Mesosutterella sp.]
MQISDVKGASKEAVNHPSHYAAHYRREVIELTSHFDFTTGNALKYVLRCRFKSLPTEDLQKARWYLNYFSDHPESGFMKKEGLEPVLADFLDDLAREKDRFFGEKASSFLRNLVAAVELAPELRGYALSEAACSIDSLIARAPDHVTRS